MNLVAITTYFRKRKYTTWSHSHSKLPHQIDHFISEKPDFCRFTDASVRKPILDSDHLAINCKLKIMVHFKKACKCNLLRKLDSDLLIDDINLSNEFNPVHDSILSDSLVDKYDTLATAMNHAATSVLPRKSRNSPKGGRGQKKPPPQS